MTGLKRITYLSFFIILTACTTPKPAITTTEQPVQQPLAKTKLTDQKPSLLAANTKKESAITKTSTLASSKQTPASSSAPTSWELAGAIAARNQNKAWTASLNWLQRGANQYQIRLFGPLGSGSVIIQKQGGVISYRDGPKSYTSRSAEELLNQQTGIRLPVNNLYYWVRGIPAPGPVQSAQRDNENRLVALHQAGYTVEYGRYNSTLPTQIKLQGAGVTIKLVVKHWKIL